jgi:hypothetical protein
MKILAILLLIFAIYKIYLYAKCWEDIFEDYDRNSIIIFSAIMSTEAIIELFCALFILL